LFFIWLVYIRRHIFAASRKGKARPSQVAANIYIMKIISEISIEDFNAWSGAKETKAAIIEAGKTEEFDSFIEELYPDGLTDTQLNDFLWFDEGFIFSSLGMETAEEEE
jgi:hypothetical protein